jgi:hypothetical protein
MISTTPEELLALSGNIGSVQGLARFESGMRQVVAELRSLGPGRHSDLAALKQCFTTVGATIGHLRHAVSVELQALGAEQDDAG